VSVSVSVCVCVCVCVKARAYCALRVCHFCASRNYSSFFEKQS